MFGVGGAAQAWHNEAVNGVGVIRLAGFASENRGAAHFFGTRQAGHLLPGEHGNRDVSATERRLRADDSPLRHLLTGCRVAAVKQVHGIDALVVGTDLPPQSVLEQGWDALVTDQPYVCLTIKTADCVPILVHDARRRVVAAIHAGWRGAVAGILPKTLSLMAERFDSRAVDVEIGIGPAAGVCCYEVDAPVIARLRDGFSDWEAVLRDRQDDRAKLHLHDLIQRQAVAAGVEPARIHAASQCTICQPERFYSYRREGAVRGTMVSGIVLTAQG